MIETSPSELRSEGFAALRRREPEAAEAAFLALLAIEPTNIYALVGLGSASRMRCEPVEAMRRFEEAAAAWPSHPWPLLEIGGQLDASGLYDEAEATLRRALQLDPRHYHVLMALGHQLRRRGDHVNAAKMFGSAAASDPIQTSPYVEWASELVWLGRQDQAISSLDAGAKAGADKIAIFKTKARILRASRRNEAALAIWTAALADKPDETVFKLEIAAEMSILGRHADALAAYRAILEDGQIATVLRCDAALAAGRVAREQKNATLALGILAHGAALDAHHVQINCEIGFLHNSENRFKDAESMFHKVLAQAPTTVSALGGLAIAKRKLGDSNEALELIKKANTLDPNNGWIKLEYANLLRDAGRTDEAVSILESVDRTSAMYAKALIMLGQMARAGGDRHRAVDYFKQAAGAVADPTEALREIVNDMRALGDLSRVESLIAPIFARDPQSYRAHMADGILKRAMNDRRGARVAFLRAAAVMPTDPQPQIELATEASALGDQDAAAAAIEAALKIDPRNEAALLQMGTLLAEGGHGDAALSLYAKMRDERPGSVSGYIAPARLLAEKGNFDDGRALLAAARKNCAFNSMVDVREAAILRQQGLMDESYELLSAAHARSPQEFWPWYSRTLAAIDMGYFDVAETLLATPPATAVQERGRVVKVRAQFDQARWALEAAINGFCAAINLDADDAAAVYEGAKLKLITFDMTGAWLDLVAYAALRSTSTRKMNPMHSLVGQLYEEYNLDRMIAVDLTALRRLSPQDQVPQLVELVRRFPDSTAPAIGLMIALRRSGRFDLQSNAVPQDLQPRIPPLITQFWNDPEPPRDVRALMSSWKESDPGFKIELFDEANALAYLREHCDPAVARAFSRASEPSQQADIFRLARLFLEGGYFVDADDRAREGLTAHVPPDAEFFAHQEDLGSIGNNVLGAVPRHPVIELALRDAVTAIMRGDREIIWLSTGPGLLTRSLARWFTAEPGGIDERIATVAVLTLAEIRRGAAIHCYAAYKNTSRGWLNAAFAKRRRR